MRGRLIVVEGLDGVGKTTLSRGLAAALGAEWTTTPSEHLRAHRGAFDATYQGLPGAAHLFYAAAVLGASREVEALRDAGRDVVVDRYWGTTRAYARANGSPYQLDEVERALPAADVTLLSVLPEDERRRRMLVRGISELDRGTLDPERSERLSSELREVLARPIAGRGVVLDLSGLDPDAAVRAAVAAVEAPADGCDA